MADPRHRVIWLTGQSGAGKTTLAKALRPKLQAIVLDGDEMRTSISEGLGFSKEDREEHNLRVARLARALSHQTPVIVSVIAPFASTRRKLDDILKPTWVYVKRSSLLAEKDKPYEEPTNAHIVVDSDMHTTAEQVKIILRYLTVL